MRRSQTAYVILGMLSIEPNHSGYDIHKAIQGSVGYFWGESFGQIYPTLKRLASEGLIAPSRAASSARPNRQEYCLTPAGHAQLQEWLAVPYRDDPPRNEFLLKLFFGRAAPPSVLIAQIRHFQERHQRLLATLLEIETLGRAGQSENPHFPFWMLTLTFGIAQARAALEWSESALAMLSAAEPQAANAV